MCKDSVFRHARALRPVAGMLLVVALLTSCIQPDATPAPDADGGGMTSAPLMETGPMPPEPPAVSTGDVVLAPLVTHWVVDDAVTRTGPQTDAEAEAIDVVSVPRTSPLVVTIGHPTVPPTLYVEVFGDLDENLHPIGPGRVVECTSEGPACSVMRRGDEALQLTVHLEPEDRLVVLQVAYTVWPEVRERVEDAPALLTASWAMALKN